MQNSKSTFHYIGGYTRLYVIKLRTISTQEKFLGFGTSQLFHISFYTLNMLCMHTQVCQGWFLMCMRDWSKKKNRRQIFQIDQMNRLWSTYLLVEHRFIFEKNEMIIVLHYMRIKANLNLYEILSWNEIRYLNLGKIKH